MASTRASGSGRSWWVPCLPTRLSLPRGSRRWRPRASRRSRPRRRSWPTKAPQSSRSCAPQRSWPWVAIRTHWWAVLRSARARMARSTGRPPCCCGLRGHGSCVLWTVRSSSSCARRHQSTRASRRSWSKGLWRTRRRPRRRSPRPSVPSTDCPTLQGGVHSRDGAFCYVSCRARTDAGPQISSVPCRAWKAACPKLLQKP
mmetsp:Transcript_46892/g.144551  ORF Transcript_46892/g.144551 Transcript_46892/m.144551 type:complete len:201 (+) Transcript_46892:1094-1696(+)